MPTGGDPGGLVCSLNIGYLFEGELPDWQVERPMFI
jgi:hypothetical protein